MSRLPEVLQLATGASTVAASGVRLLKEAQRHGRQVELGHALDQFVARDQLRRYWTAATGIDAGLGAGPTATWNSSSGSLSCACT